ncbi:MAG: PAS and helix-turn-helix domain-containing protein [Desulfovibrionales bacterium]|nr:PAS and helix-turn-helix domain-containing protein [Desulfovibrionales bacterium]
MVTHVHSKHQYWAQVIGQSLPEILGLNEQSIDKVISSLAQEQICSPPALKGERILVHLAPLPQILCADDACVVCVLPVPTLGILEKEAATDDPSPPTPALDYAVFNAVFNDARDAIILVDNTFHVLAANRKAQRVYAPRPDQPLTSLNFLPMIDPKDQKNVLSAFEKLKEGTSWRTSLVTINKTGTQIPVKCKIRCLSTRGVQLYQIMLRDLRRHMALEKDLIQSRQAVAGMNIALKQVLLNVEEEKQELKEELVQQVREEVLPAVDRLVKEDSVLVREAFKSALQDKIADLSDVHSGPLQLSTLLTPRETDVCRLIQQGWQGRAIADELSISFETLQTHRKNIRHKLGLKGAGISLVTFLQQHPPL